MNTIRRIITTLLCLLLVLALAACGRTRTGLEPQEELREETQQPSAQAEIPPAAQKPEDPLPEPLQDPSEETQEPEEEPPQEAPAEEPPQQEPEQPEAEPPREDPPEQPPKEPDSKPDESLEDPASTHRQFDENASGEEDENAGQSLGTGEAGANTEEEPAAGEASEGAAYGAAEGAELALKQTEGADEAEQTGISETAEVADSSLVYYQTLLFTRLGDLFECKRYYVYCETPEDHVTVLKGSNEYELIQLAGAYSVSSKLQADGAAVTDDWVVRKNPDVIIKLVGPELLGRSVTSDTAAESVRSELTAREGWSDIAAVREGRVILLSTELLDNEVLQTAAGVYLAKLLYPDSFTDTDPDEAFAQLTQEYYGSALSGTFLYAE